MSAALGHSFDALLTHAGSVQGLALVLGGEVLGSEAKPEASVEVFAIVGSILYEVRTLERREKGGLFRRSPTRFAAQHGSMFGISFARVANVVVSIKTMPPQVCEVFCLTFSYD